MDEQNEIKIQKKCKINKISFLLISFYSGVISISDLGLKFYLKDQKEMSTSTFTIIIILIKVAYLIKPIYGLLIDFKPIFGYKKKIYLFLCFFINIVSWSIFIFNSHNFILSIICHFLINVSISFTTVIGSAIQIEISRLQDKQNGIGKSTLSLNSQHHTIKTIGTLIPSYFNRFLIQKYSYDIIFYMSSIFSLFILISGLLLDEDKINKNRRLRKVATMSFIPIKKRRESSNNKLSNLINNKNILLLLLLIFILESSPSCTSPLFYYETNILGLKPKDLGLIDFTSQIAIIIFIKIYNFYFYKINFKLITFFVRILIFGSFSLIYLLITKSTQEYINDFVLLTISSSLRAGLHSLAQLPYIPLCIKYSPLGLEATTFAFSVCCCNLGNIFSELIDYLLGLYFNVTIYDFINIGKLVFVENILNLIPLIYIWIVPLKFFSAKKGNSSDEELSSLEKEKDSNNNIDNKEENNIINENENENKIANYLDTIIQNFIEDDEEDTPNVIDMNNSYRHYNFDY